MAETGTILNVFEDLVGWPSINLNGKEAYIRHKDFGYIKGLSIAKDTEHLKVSEFTCKCCCGKNNIDQRVIDMAETIRLALGVPVHVNSGCRCDKHNKADGKLPDLDYCILYKWGIHIDCGGKRKNLWEVRALPKTCWDILFISFSAVSSVP